LESREDLFSKQCRVASRSHGHLPRVSDTKTRVRRFESELLFSQAASSAAPRLEAVLAEEAEIEWFLFVGGDV